ncbi:uncharacterized protein Z520_03555 [Fonsecaea multimorphosa CBS 102226]|uniref:DUF6594 domain-containing protein n=1 Tax=Fonsecaea multimorphosa CBS 102226 TaxID=1442371 RepID=A0A0D2KVY1_9EURO|nr:uncharacterized protein Z520_03555 [Fonsecaea multimorphosa CBS 102226]KIY00889.1 hypothetical protein Z520_03555 [Fonsecaea multimorphosa CBS 102226]
MATPEDHHGYAKVARLMECHSEFGIFRSFSCLNFQNLLYLQAELTQLEQELKQIVQTDRASDDPTRSLQANHWQLLKNSQQEGRDGQFQKVMQIRAVLKEYNEALLQHRGLSSLKKPTKYKINFLRDWRDDPKLGGQPIISDDRHAWSEAHEGDLISTTDTNQMDATSTWISETLLPNYHWWIGKHHKEAVDWDPLTGIANYSNKGIVHAVDILATVVSCLFSVLSIVALNAVQSISLRIGMTAVFTAVFCLCLAAVTEARRIEVFAATSA